ncbi:MAG: zinc-binding dehydrogenase [Gemmatimonadaceae bacterium]|nr:zinc-binding dehydrogenase [Gemmatimonadaceae bacterium]MDQ3244562.1 zinc-binding dehydrogenase [Gemmatimonadota bacterium]
MRALTISAHGGTEQLEFRDDLPMPDPPPGHVRVRLRAAALNRLDVFTLGGLPGVTIVPPWIMGADGTGVIDSLGEGVDAVAAGETVVINPGISDGTCEFCVAGEQSLCVQFKLLGEHLPGTLAEYVVVPSRNVLPIPDRIPPERAGAYTLATLTAWRMLVTRAKVTSGDEVLIWGIGGGVALAALQIAKDRGAKVWVTSGSDEKLERARELGADETLNHRTVHVAKEIRARTRKRGVSLVVDSVGEATWAESLGALGRGGRLVTCGGTSGPQVQTDVRRLFWNQWSIMGSTMGNESEFDAVTAEFRAGRLVPVVDSVFDLDNGRAAFERLAAGEQFGKIVVRIS